MRRIFKPFLPNKSKVQKEKGAQSYKTGGKEKETAERISIEASQKDYIYNKLEMQTTNSAMLQSKNSDQEEEEMSRSALTSFRVKEEQIDRKRIEVRERVFAQLGRVEEETKRLAIIREELEALADPTRKEVTAIRRRIDTINRELKPLGQTCLKKENEYKEALETFNEKNKEKAQLVNKLMELVNESERLRMRKLEELSKTIDSIR